MNHPIISGLKDKRILVTGATGGIGSCLVRLFAEEGATLGIHYHQNQEHAESLSREIKAGGGKAECFQEDLLSTDELRLVHDFIERFGGIDVLINNAGGIRGFKEFLDLDKSSWDETHRLNAQAPFFLAQQAFAYMKKQGGGKIINISSIAAKYGGSSKSLHYGAAKAALEAVTIGLARAGAPYRILVNSVRGGFINTPMHQNLGRIRIEERVEKIPLKRAGEPEDLGRMVLFLSSGGGDFITGETFSVAGGD
tara:strand:+ start:48 stop:806 length:759 start_codon:yes stop_codon:yes gene_type:complete